ncbi:MAG: hypothetical protein EBQ82_01630 [Betaproteobacteria bacterium]|nr:hypothetical protein [Betaproteobacteria bacterium]NBY04113.1 hypothetical protein [Betaproteobacteria bacterium]
MNALDALWHLLHLTVPALAVAAWVSLMGPLVVNQAIGNHLIRRMLVNGMVGVAALAAGLWFWGKDGKMSTYAAMVLACASSQWLLMRAWRRQSGPPHR